MIDPSSARLILRAAGFLLIQFPPLWFVGAVVLIAFGCWQIYALPLRPLRALLDEKGGNLSGILTARLEGHFQGRGVKFKSGGHGLNSQELEISMGSSLACSFQMQRKSLGSTAFNGTLALASAGRLTIPEVPAGDSETMRGLTFCPSTNPRLVGWLRESEVQQAIGFLFAGHGVDSLRMEGGFLIASCLFVFGKKYTPENVKSILEEMAILARSLEALPS